MTRSIGFRWGEWAGGRRARGTSDTDRPADVRGHVSAEVVHHDDVVWPKFRDQHLLDIGAEALAVDRSVDDLGSHDAFLARGGQECHGVPVSEGSAPNQPPATRRLTPEWGYVGLGRGLI